PAPTEFAALAEELQAQIKSSSGRESNVPTTPLLANGEQTAHTETNAWFGKLPPEKQSEVVKYATMHIAKNSKLFELTKHGGNNAEYFKLTMAIARSGVTDAEDIFVQTASTAKDADTEEDLRKFFQSCKNAEVRANGVTVGTLLHIASQHGADFSQWKQTA